MELMEKVIKENNCINIEIHETEKQVEKQNYASKGHLKKQIWQYTFTKL